MSTAYAPGRVNLIGEHTDYTGGFVLPMAVSMGVTCTVTLRDDTTITAESREMPGDRVEADIATVQPADVQGWAAYVIGTAWALREQGFRVPGCDVHIESTVPAGAGLSSSAAVECAVALAILAGSVIIAERLSRSLDEKNFWAGSNIPEVAGDVRNVTQPIAQIIGAWTRA